MILVQENTCQERNWHLSQKLNELKAENMGEILCFRLFCVSKTFLRHKIVLEKEKADSYNQLTYPNKQTGVCVQIIFSLAVHGSLKLKKGERMNYTEFVHAMLSKTREQMEPEVRVEIHTAVKNNSTERTGLVLMRQGVNMSPTIYLEEFYERYLNGTELPDLVKTIQDLYQKIRVKKSYPYEDILSYEKVKEKIVYKVIQKETNEKLLREIPHEEFLNLAVVFYIILEYTTFGTASLLIRNEHLKMWNVSETEIVETAKQNTPELLPAELEKLTDYMYVLTNKTRNLGAAVMLYPDTGKKVWQVIGENFYILPSSIHELILIPESYGVERTQLECMVREINQAEVEAEEVLAESVYYYSGKEDRILL